MMSLAWLGPKLNMFLLVIAFVALCGAHGAREGNEGESEVLTTPSPSPSPRRGLKAEEPFPDEPIQLVAPDLLHKKLVVIKENVKYLHQIKGPVATVAVVGKFHSGKSFLMNQLMGKSNGFGVGPSVEPKTMGIWMWGRPAVMELYSGLKVSLVFLDTEGFAANNVSENYDAKIFAVATILSSHLLYNSVKIIDQVDIDYLELLARRTQLFALRSQMSRSKWINDFNEDLLSFPPLIWIVQDFFQDTIGGESPREWLHRLMTSHSRENEHYEISILDIFKSVDCHTMFLPATQKRLLNDLSKATEADLTSEYKEERDSLVVKLKKDMKPKEKNHRPINGVELALLLEILVNAANEGSLADVPSRWDSFVDRLQQTATDDCLKFYEDEMSSFLSEHNANEPLKMSRFDDLHNQTVHRSIELMKHVLQGLDDASKHGLHKLKHRIELSNERSRDLNSKKIKLKLSQIQNSVEIQTEESLRKLAFPLSTAKLLKISNKLKEVSSKQFTQQIEKFEEADKMAQNVEVLHKSLKNIVGAIQLQNNEAIEAYFKQILSDAENKFVEVVRIDWNKSSPQKPLRLKKIVEEAKAQALNLYQEKCTLFMEETGFAANFALLKQLLNEKEKEVQLENEDLATDFIKSHVFRFGEQFKERTSSEFISFPVFDADLESRLSLEINRVIRDFEEVLGDYAEYSGYSLHFQGLKQEVGLICDLRRKENLDAFTREVSKPLETATKIVLLSCDRYSTVFSLKQFIRSVCLLHLDDGKPKTWPLELKLQIIENYMASDEEIKKVIGSREGLWSSIVGFFQWILWLFDFK